MCIILMSKQMVVSWMRSADETIEELEAVQALDGQLTSVKDLISDDKNCVQRIMICCCLPNRA